MHGIVNRGLQLFLIEEYGEDFWRELAFRKDTPSLSVIASTAGSNVPANARGPIRAVGKRTPSSSAKARISTEKGSEPPHLNWSSAMFRKRRTDNDEQTTEAGRDYHEVEAS